MYGSVGSDFRNTDPAAYRASSNANQARFKRDDRQRILKAMLDEGFDPNVSLGETYKTIIRG